MKYTVCLMLALAAAAGSPPLGAQTNTFVRIQGGTFMMGSPTSEGGRQKDEPQHQVTVGTFYMEQYEVTQESYEAVMGENPSYYKGAKMPVECVSWYDAVEYCNRRSQREGLTPAYTINKNQQDPNNIGVYDRIKWLITWNQSANGYRLPTEAEWEYACRAGSGDSFSGPPETAAWYWDNSAEHTHQVGLKQPNPWGLHDMHGNVWEWCWDWYAAYAEGPQTNPAGPPAGSHRVERGGSWGDYRTGLRSASRLDFTPSSRNGRLGFRLARSSL